MRGGHACHTASLASAGAAASVVSDGAPGLPAVLALIATLAAVFSDEPPMATGSACGPNRGPLAPRFKPTMPSAIGANTASWNLDELRPGSEVHYRLVEA